jgi:AraC-like DNA-binding protein
MKKQKTENTNSAAWFTKRDFVHLSPGAYRIRCRLEQAQELLVNTQAPLASIAERLGYYDEYPFANHFKRFNGISPGRFRRLEHSR